MFIVISHLRFRGSKVAVAVKTPITYLSDSASEEENSSGSDFEPDADHISEDDVDIGELSDDDVIALEVDKRYPLTRDYPVLMAILGE